MGFQTGWSKFQPVFIASEITSLAIIVRTKIVRTMKPLLVGALSKGVMYTDRITHKQIFESFLARRPRNIT